jgi:hypothetical protein
MTAMHLAHNFLQLSELQAHRRALAAMTSEVQVHMNALTATKDRNVPDKDKHHMHTIISTGLEVNDPEHTNDSEIANTK